MLSVMMEVWARCPGNIEAWLSKVEQGSMRRFHRGGDDIWFHLVSVGIFLAEGMKKV